MIYSIDVSLVISVVTRILEFKVVGAVLAAGDLERTGILLVDRGLSNSLLTVIVIELKERTADLTVERSTA